VDDVVYFFPGQCEHCSHSLPRTAGPHAKPYQFTELPAFEPHTTEFRRHKVQCLCCGKTTRAAYDAQKIPSSRFGPRLMSAVVLLTGVYHLSRRRAVTLLSDLVGVRISLGAVSSVEHRVSEAIAPAVEEAHEHVVHAAVKHTEYPLLGAVWRGERDGTNLPG
jgi:transposase